MALSARVGPLRASFAVDTGALVNVISDNAFRIIKRESRGGRYPLRESDLDLRGVSDEKLAIQGMVNLPLRFGNDLPAVSLKFYVVSGFALPADGLIGLATCRTYGVVIRTDSSIVEFSEFVK